MTKLQQWQKVKEIVGSALERPPAERATFLDEACAQDSELRSEVESLLSAHREANGLSEFPWRDVSTDPEEQPRVVGAYRLLKELGVGGMGQVWLAEQTEPVHRQVALKSGHGVCRWPAHHRLLRCEKVEHSRTSAVIHPCLRRGTARSSEGHHPSRPETIEHSGG